MLEVFICSSEASLYALHLNTCYKRVQSKLLATFVQLLEINAEEFIPRSNYFRELKASDLSSYSFSLKNIT